MKHLQFIILVFFLFAESCSNGKAPDDSTLQDYPPVDTISVSTKADTIIQKKLQEESAKLPVHPTAVIIVRRNWTICVVLIQHQKMIWMTMVCSVTLMLMMKKHGINRYVYLYKKRYVRFK